MHDRLVNEVAMGKRFALIIGCTLASADAFRRSVAWASLSHPSLHRIKRSELPRVPSEQGSSSGGQAADYPRLVGCIEAGF